MWARLLARTRRATLTSSPSEWSKLDHWYELCEGGATYSILASHIDLILS